VIIEGIVSTLDPGGGAHVAPMGPDVDPALRRIVLAPFGTSTTGANLRRHPEGVFHVIDDAELLARAAIGLARPDVRPAVSVRGWILEAACRALEFRVTAIDDSSERIRMEAEVVRAEEIRGFPGWNRARHAVLEAAILATRAHLLPRQAVLEKLASLAVLVKKTGGPAEEEALRLLREHVNTIESPPPALPRRVRVTAGSRLHFGLIAPGGDDARRHGGAGLMVALPRVEILVERSDRPRASGPLGERALESATRAAEAPISVHVESAPRPHTGLGTGTQLALAAAKGAALLDGRDIPAPALAARTGRGARSAIGVHGFDSGGFIVDGGRRSAEPGSSGIAPLVSRIEFPPGWRIVLATPTSLAGLSGKAEEDAFRKLDADRGQTAELCRIVQLGMAPALAEGDLSAFSTALGEYGDLAGARFSRVQGGIFASPLVASIVDLARSLGARGSGQTSWGPSVYAVCGGAPEAEELARAIGRRFGPEVDVLVTEPLNSGARVETWSDTPSLHTLA